MIRNSLKVIAAIGAMTFAAQPAFSAPPPLNGQVWMIGKNGPVVAFNTCGQALCGKIVSLPGWKGPPNDEKNPDPGLRPRPLCGLMVITGLMPQGDIWGGGRFYAPPHGKTVNFAVKGTAQAPVGKISGMMPFPISMGFVAVTADTPHTCPK